MSGREPERRKLVTVLFCDVSGSTELGERADPEAVRGLMKRYHEEMQGAVERHGGTVEKFVGDAVMAVFGVPVAHEDDAMRAVRAAVEMRDRAASLNDELRLRFGASIDLRMGLDTGEVVAGDPSLREAFVTGDAVNVAARLEKAAATGEILIGPETARLTGHAVVTEALPPLELKGKRAPVEAQRVLAVAHDARPRPPGAEKPLVGRSHELTELEGALAEVVAAGKCRLVTVVGEAGIGKSRLAAELEAAAGARTTVLRGRCLSYGEGITFWPVAEIVRAAAGIDERHTRDEARSRIALLVAGEADAELVAGGVARAIGLEEGPGATAEIGRSIGRLLEVMSTRTPLLLVVDDIHWAEPTLLDLLADLPEHVGGPALVLCLARPELTELRPEWPVTVALRPLPDDETLALVDALAGADGPGDDTRARIVRRCGGNPLFAQELVTAVGEKPETGVLPVTLGALLSERLDRLPGPERSVLEAASVEGEVFHLGALAELTAPEDPRTAIEQLADRELVLEEDGGLAGETAFRFRHLLIRDAVYRGMTKARRADLHERYAAWAERLVGGRMEEYAEILGYHLERACRLRSELGPATASDRALSAKAAELLASAGRRAFARGDMGASASLLTRAGELSPPDTRRRLDVTVKLTSALWQSGDLARTAEAADEALAQASAAGDELLALRTRLELVAMGLETSGDEAATAERAIQIFRTAGDHKGLARAWRLLGGARIARGEAAAAREALEQALAQARLSDDWREQAVAGVALAEILEEDPTPAEAAIERCEALLAEAEGRWQLTGGILTTTGLLHAMRGRFDEARRFLDLGKRNRVELGLKLDDAVKAAWSARVELMDQKPEAAEAAARAGYAVLRRMEDARGEAYVGCVLAQSLAAQGRDAEANELAAGSRALYESGRMADRTLWLSTQARLLAQGGRAGEAEALCREAVELTGETDLLNRRAEALYDLARVLALAGRGAETRTLLEDAAGLFKQKGNIVGAIRARVRIASV